MEPFTLDDFKELIALIESDAGEKSMSKMDQQRLFVQTNVNEIMLRTGYFYRQTLTIARIEVASPRKGTGSSWLAWLENFARIHHYESILLESIATPDGVGFAKKHGFLPIMSSGFISKDGYFMGDWKYNLKEENHEHATF